MGEENARRIPTELEIEVLQHIADEDEGDHSRWLALVNCALVCKAWTRYVRVHLYYAININMFKGLLLFEHIRQYPHLQPFLREFTWPRNWKASYLSVSNQDTIKSVAPTVTKLRVDHQYLEPWLKESISTFTNINELDMTGSIFENWTTVVRVVSSFPFLATLAMPCTCPFQVHDDPDDPDDPEVSYPPPSRLVHIKLASGCETETVSWICRESPIPNIGTVEVGSKIDSNVLATLLRSLGGELRHLII